MLFAGRLQKKRQLFKDEILPVVTTGSVYEAITFKASRLFLRLLTIPKR